MSVCPQVIPADAVAHPQMFHSRLQTPRTKTDVTRYTFHVTASKAAPMHPASSVGKQMFSRKHQHVILSEFNIFVNPVGNKIITELFLSLFSSKFQ